jgi:hypothetical protein
VPAGLRDANRTATVGNTANKRHHIGEWSIETDWKNKLAEEAVIFEIERGHADVDDRLHHSDHVGSPIRRS